MLTDFLHKWVPGLVGPRKVARRMGRSEPNDSRVYRLIWCHSRTGKSRMYIAGDPLLPEERALATNLMWKVHHTAENQLLMSKEI